MQVRVRKKKTQYAMVHQNLIFDSRISLAAKGLGAIIEYYSDGYEVSFFTISSKSKNGKTALKTALNELSSNGYLLILQSKDGKGRFATTWVFDSEGLEEEFALQVYAELDSPNVKRSPWPDFPTTVTELTAKPLTEKRPHNQKRNNHQIFDHNTLSFQKFREGMIERFEGQQIPLPHKLEGWLPEASFSVKNGYLVNDLTGKLLSSTDAFHVWSEIFKTKGEQNATSKV